MNDFVDLHMHSIFSDGSDDLPALLDNLRQRNIMTFSLTDHDTISGCIEMGRLVPSDMRFIRGIEFSCVTAAGKCHILGYGCDEANPDLLAAIRQGHRLRTEKLEGRISYLQEVHNISFSEEELAGLRSLGSVGKPHIANLLVKKGIAQNREDAIRRLINGYHAGSDRIEADAAIRAVLSAGGIPVWAHPLGGEGERRLTKDAFYSQLSVLKQAGIEGLECFYSRYTSGEIAFLTAEAEKNRLSISGGSDYHGTNKTVPLGCLCADRLPVSGKLLTILERL